MDRVTGNVTTDNAYVVPVLNFISCLQLAAIRINFRIRRLAVLISRAGLTTVPVVPWEPPPRSGGPHQLPNFYHTVLTFERTFRNHTSFVA